MLAGLVVHELRWQQTLDAIINLRRRFRVRFGLKLREEIHSSELIQSPGELRRITRWERLMILREVAEFEAHLSEISLLHVVVDKSPLPDGADVFDVAWRALIQRFHNTISYKNFPGPANPDERGLLLTDATDGEKLQRLARRLRKFNPIPNRPDYGPGYRQIPIDRLVEDPIPRDSRHSYFLQLCDVNAYLLTQLLVPNKFFRKRGCRNLFDRLDPVLCKVAAKADPRGIVRL